MWLNTALDAFNVKKTVYQRIRWLAVFFKTVMLNNPIWVLDQLLQHRSDFLINTRVAKESYEAKKEYVLTAMEWFLRANGVMPDDTRRKDGTFQSACEYVGLPRPQKMPEIDRESYSQVNFFYTLALVFWRKNMINNNVKNFI